MSLAWLISFLLVIFVNFGECSFGDRSHIFQSCLLDCRTSNCRFGQDGLIWTCEDDCKYNCMWKAVEYFTDVGRDVPQFYGKWPFVRLLGMQEPASALFSLLNLAAHAHMLRQFVRSVPPHAPLFWLWITYALVCINAWLWSTVFHTKDTDLTEKADYFCAFSMVLFSAYSACIRFLGARLTWATVIVSAGCATLMAYHVAYLSLVHFDYGYNMKANILVGAVNVLSWLAWCWRQRRLGYVWRCAATVSAVSLSLLLETADFAPLGWVLDAHALWHLSTSPLPLLWYRFTICSLNLSVAFGRFLIDDCLYQLSQQKILQKSV